MCRYAMADYKPHYACFQCRKSFKRRLLIDIKGGRAAEESVPAKCPDCGNLMANMGLDFEAPKKKAVKEWKHIEDLYEAGITFHSCGCSGPGFVPKDRDQLLAYLEEQRDCYLEHRLFWARRAEPENPSQSEKQKDFNKGWTYMAAVPGELKTGSRKNVKIESDGARAYWTERILEVEQKMERLTKGQLQS